MFWHGHGRRTDRQHLACPAEEGRTWDSVSGTNHPLQDTVVLTACCVRAMKVPLYKRSVALPLGTLGFVWTSQKNPSESCIPLVLNVGDVLP